jgi:peptidoglycan/LPS O-acetylase OafA/YrhL
MQAWLFLSLVGYAAAAAVTAKSAAAVTAKGKVAAKSKVAAAQRSQTAWDLGAGLSFVSKSAMEALDPTKSRIFDQPQAAQVMENTVFPLLDKYLPGGLPKVENKDGLKPSGQLFSISKNPELNIKLETAAFKVMQTLAADQPNKVREFAEPEIRKRVMTTWVGNNNTKQFYAGEQVKLLNLAIEKKGVLFAPLTAKDIKERYMWTGVALIAPLVIWAALSIATALCAKETEVLNNAPAAEEKRFFPHLDGMRTVAAIIIIWFHYSGILGPYSLVAAQNEVIKPRFTPVSFFLVLSGFCMHYAYCKKLYKDAWDVLKYMVNRLGRVMPSYWIAFGVFFFVMHPLYSPFLKKGDQYWTARFNTAALWTFFGLQSWTEWSLTYTPEALTPTEVLTGMRQGSGGSGYAGDFGNLWTVSTLLLPWLMYPLLHLIVTSVAKYLPGFGIRAFTVLMYIAGVAPGVYLYNMYGDELAGSSVYTLKVNPVYLLPQFVLGMCAAQLLKQAEEKPEEIKRIPKWIYTVIADLSITLTFVLVLAVPFRQFDRGFEVLFVGGEGHLIAAWLYFSCLPGVSKGVWTALTGNPLMVKMGEYAMHVYLLQYPLAVVMDAAINGLPADSRPPFTGWVGQLQLVVGLWTMSIIFAEVLDKPLQGLLSKVMGSK